MLHEQIFKSYKFLNSAISQMKNILNFCLKNYYQLLISHARVDFSAKLRSENERN